MKRLILVIVALLTVAAAPPVVKPKAPIKVAPRVGIESGRKTVDYWKMGGRKFHAGQPGKPAVLLFHGLHRDIRCWTNPGDDEGVLCYTFREQPGKRSLGEQSYAGVGIYKVGVTDRELEINPNNFFDYLASRGFTVAAFSQGEPKMEDAMPTAEAAYDAFLAETQKRFPDAPPPVCLLGHSRGGLVIRQLLKNRGTAPRVKWVITLHSPHGGSDLARTPALVEKKIRERVAAAMPQIGIVESDIGEQVADDVIAALKPMFDFLDSQLDAESRELAPDSDFMKQLAAGEKPTDGVQYFTFAGNNPNYMRLYYWTFTAGSSLPQYKVSLESQKQYFKWEVVPHEIGQASPIYADVAQSVLPEVTGGKGDGLVSLDRAKLPWPATHKVNNLNHAECLFDRGIQREVAAILGDRGVLDDIAKKATVALATTRSSRRGVELPRDVAAATTQRVPALTREQATTGVALERPPIADAAAGADRDDAAAGGFVSVPNPKMKGRLGRIVVAFPKEAPAKGTHVAIRKPGDDKDLKTFYGGGEQELMPGKYVVIVNKKPVGEVVVQSKHDRKIRTGVLHVHAGNSTHIRLLDSDGKTELVTGYGEQEWGLPVGKYHLEIAGQAEPVEVTEDQVTEF